MRGDQISEVDLLNRQFGDRVMRVDCGGLKECCEFAQDGPRGDGPRETRATEVFERVDEHPVIPESFFESCELKRETSGR